MVVLTGAGVLAQTAQQDVEARIDQVEPRPQAFEGPSVQFTSQRAPANAEGIVFDLMDIQIEGATLYEDDELRALYADTLGQEATLLEVFNIAGAVQKLYRDDDYVFTRVVVPAQNIEKGVVKLEVIEAVIVAVDVEEPGDPIGPAKALVQEMVEPLVGLTNPTGSFLERILLNINEIPGFTRATAVPQPGADGGRGALALFINVERDPFEAVLFGDNRQVPGVGRGIFGGYVRFHSYSEAGDTTTISYFNSFGYLTEGPAADGTRTAPRGDGGFGDFDERNTLHVEHSRYINEDGATLSGTFLFSRSRPGDDLTQVGLEGQAVVASVEAGFPLYRTRQVSFSAAVGAEVYSSDTDVSNGAFRVADDRLRTAYLRFDGLARDGLGYTRFTIEGRQGLKLLNQSDPTTDAALSRADGRGDYSLIRASAERLVEVNDDFDVFLKAGCQISATPLLASEEFAIGGLTFGRGFDPSEFTGDDGFGLMGEFRYTQEIDFFDFIFDAELYAFAEYGVIFNQGTGEPGREDIASAGGGVRLFLPDQYVLGLELAFPIDQPLERTSKKDGRMFVNFSKRF